MHQARYMLRLPLLAMSSDLFFLRLMVIPVAIFSSPAGKLKEWSLVLYGTSVHPYSSLRYEKTRSAEPPTDYDLPEEYNGELVSLGGRLFFLGVHLVS